MAMGTDYDVLFIPVRIEALVAVQREGICFEIFPKGHERRFLRPGTVATCIRNEEMMWIDLDVYVWLLAVTIIFDDDES